MRDGWDSMARDHVDGIIPGVLVVGARREDGPL